MTRNNKEAHEEIPESMFQSATSMTIGIAAPSPVPFVVGGAEKLWWGLQDYINKNTAHRCELIKVCAKDITFADLAASYDRFYHLDLRHFDLVLTTRYPAWMVRHPNHHVYFQHPLRRLYDRYNGAEALSSNVRAYPGVKKILGAVDAPRLEVRRLLDACMELAGDPAAPEEALLRHGPLARQIVHAMDHHAVCRASRVFAISETVRARSGYFPDPKAVPVVYHPSNLGGFRDSGQNYFLAVSRLVPQKRIRLILDAWRHAGLKMPLRVVGSGPEMTVLRKMASGNPHVEFTGFVSDRTLAELYSGALAVVFVPENEDLGLVALEAMHAGKPVITCTDSGGATEWVRRGRTGWVCAPDAADVARAMRDAASDVQKAAEMGRRAREHVRGVTWENLAAALFYPPPAVSTKKSAGPAGVFSMG